MRLAPRERWILAAKGLCCHPVDGWTRATGEAGELVEGVPSATSFTSPRLLPTSPASHCCTCGRPPRAEIAQIMGEARSHAEREVLA